MLGVSVASDFKLKSVLIYHSENSRALKNYTKYTLPVLYKWNNKAWMTAYLFITWLVEYLNTTVEITAQKKKNPVKILLLVDNVLGHSIALMEIYNDINDVFMPDNTSILHPMYQGVILIFKYYIKYENCKAIAVI